MCISANPASFSNTHLYAGEAMRNSELVHVMAYQNCAWSDGPNAMILPLPAIGTMGPENIIDTRKFSDFMIKIAKANRIESFSKNRSLDITKGITAAASFQIFETGSYTVVIADSVKGIKASLQEIPINKRPELSTKFLIGFGNLYKDSKIVLCCWEGEIEAEPILLWYKPRNPEVLFAPAMDAHDGNAPDPNAEVDVDHYISFSLLKFNSGNSNKVIWGSGTRLPSDLLPDYVIGTKLTGPFYNGDFYATNESLSKRKMIRAASLKSGHQEKLSLKGWE